MSKIKIVQGDLFTATPGSILIHSCNTKGKWGSGIAVEFARRFPRAYAEYQDECAKYGNVLLGRCRLLRADLYTIGCLFVSSGESFECDPPDKILAATDTAFAHLLVMRDMDYGSPNRPIAMPKINSGLFKVPWEDTYKLLEQFDTEMKVYELV